MGIGLIAVCLPTLRPLLHEISIKSVVCNVSSRLHLESLRVRSRSSLAKDDAARRSRYLQRAVAPKNPATSQLSEDTGYLETHIMADRGDRSRCNQPYVNKINVCNDLTQSVERV